MMIERARAEQQLERVLSSVEFSAAPKMQTLLRYLAEAALDGRGDRLKGYTIGVDVFERGTDFDPQQDSIVRVQVGRLRKLLEEYYSGAGANDPVRIVLPRGGYTISFLPSAVGANAPPQAGGLIPRRLLPLVIAGSVTALVLVASAAQYVGLFRDGSRFQNPSIAVAPYAAVDGAAMSGQISGGIQYALINYLSSFRDLRVASVESGEGAAARGAGADFVLSGAVQTDGGDVQVTSQLTRVADGRIVWTDVSSSSQRDVAGLFALQSAIAAGVASQLAQPHGVVQEQMRADIEAARDLRWSDYECELAQVAYTRHVSEAEHARVRACLEDVVRNAPRYSSAWVLLAWMYGEEERNGFNRRPQAFERALRAAERAVGVNPRSEMANLALASARFDVNDIEGFRAAAERAQELNPNNSEVLAAIGERLAILDASPASKALLERALALNPNHPPWYENGLAIHALLTGDERAALAHARAYAREGHGLPTLILAAALRANGDNTGADAALRAWEVAAPEQFARRAEILEAWHIPASIRRQALGAPPR